MQTLSDKRIGNFTGSDGHKLFMKPSITELQLSELAILQNKENRTDKQQARLKELIKKRDTKVSSADRDTYIKTKAEEKATGYQKSFSSWSTNHGEMFEFDALQEFQTHSGLIVEHNQQKYWEINENCGATPDALVKDFDGTIIATVDAKCPTSSFFEQKLIYVNQLYPEYQYCTKDKYYQAQWQMLAVGVDKHYLVRYLPEEFDDKYGNPIKNKMPIEQRIFWQIIERDNEVCGEILELVKQAVEERDLYYKIFTQQIIKKEQAI